MVGEQLEEHHAERVEVAASVDLLPAALLGRHVVGRPADQTRSRDRRGVRPHDRRQPEVDDLHQVASRREAAEDDVLRLQVAVDDVVRVRFLERAEHGHQDIAGAREGQGPLLVHHHGEVLPLEEFHRQVEDAVIRSTEIDDADAVRVIQPAARAGLRVEASDRLLVAEQVRVDHLDRHRTAERALFGPVHAAHPTHADDLLEHVASADRTPDQRILGAARALCQERGAASRAEPVVRLSDGSALWTDSHGRERTAR